MSKAFLIDGPSCKIDDPPSMLLESKNVFIIKQLACITKERFPEIDYNLLLQLSRKYSYVREASIDELIEFIKPSKTNLMSLNNIHDDGTLNCQCGGPANFAAFHHDVDGTRLYNSQFGFGICPFVLFCMSGRCRNRQIVWRVYSTAV
jgi:hypothetical protein